MKASEVLRKAKELIDKPEKWHHGDMAMGPNGEICIGCSIAHAVANGTCPSISDWGHPALEKYMRASVPAVTDIMYLFHPVYRFNASPSTTHSDVMAAFDRAIALAEADERKNEPWTLADTQRALSEIVAHADEAIA